MDIIPSSSAIVSYVGDRLWGPRRGRMDGSDITSQTINTRDGSISLFIEESNPRSVVLERERAGVGRRRVSASLELSKRGRWKRVHLSKATGPSEIYATMRYAHLLDGKLPGCPGSQIWFTNHVAFNPPSSRGVLWLRGDNLVEGGVATIRAGELVTVTAQRIPLSGVFLQGKTPQGSKWLNRFAGVGNSRAAHAYEVKLPYTLGLHPISKRSYLELFRRALGWAAGLDLRPLQQGRVSLFSWNLGEFQRPFLILIASALLYKSFTTSSTSA